MSDEEQWVVVVLPEGAKWEPSPSFYDEVAISEVWHVEHDEDGEPVQRVRYTVGDEAIDVPAAPSSAGDERTDGGGE